MKRLAGLALVLGATIVACAPPAVVENNVVPTLVSIQLPEDPQDDIVLQGRYFGDGQGGEADDSYLVVGGNSDCSGGYRIEGSSWSSNRITFRDPGGVGSGFVCVVADGVTSNPLPADLN